MPQRISHYRYRSLEVIELFHVLRRRLIAISLDGARRFLRVFLREALRSQMIRETRLSGLFII